MAQAVLDIGFAGIELDHPAAQAGIGELVADLQSAAELTVREGAVAGSGWKGASIELIVSLGAPGTLAALVRIVKLWLGRDRRRSIILSVRNGPEGAVITIEGEEVSVDTLTDALNSIATLNQG
jgi:hypothetical protein